MADRIFPNTYQEEPLDSDLVFKGIDWDNFNTKLAEVKEGLHTPELPEEFREVLAGKNEMPEEVEEMFKKKNKRSPDADDLSDVPEQLRPSVEKAQERAKKKHHDDDADDKDTKKNKDHDKKDPKKNVEAKECTCKKKPCTCGWASEHGDMKKKASYNFTHPSQISADAIESAIASGDQELANAILACRHERRVRLASKIEERFAAENDKNERLAKRRAYRESLVAKVASQEKSIREAQKSNQKNSDEFTKVSKLNNSAKKAFASKAIAEGFPKEYVDAILGKSTTVVDNTVEIKSVMASNLPSVTKKTVVASMVKEATLTDADYTRLINYWKNELGYGDQDWIEALFTKKYDK